MLFTKAQSTDSTHIIDSTLKKKDSLPASVLQDSVRQQLLSVPEYKPRNPFLNAEAKPVSYAVEFRKEKDTDGLFYLLTGIVLILAFFRFFYNRYFTNLFRVFFNTSLRQSQLTDQLLQAKLPSLLFNLFFVISGGMYVYVLLLHYELIAEENRWQLIGASMAVLGIVYFLKYVTLKFTGWITGLREATNTYVFVIFLINKIIGIFLVPFTIILTFSDPVIAKSGVIISLLSIGLFLLLRFFRSYGLLQNQLKISRFHFILYIMGIELVPLLLIYKGLMLYLSKSL